jgi:sporulation protein YlmC with PRC-barrel domain
MKRSMNELRGYQIATKDGTKGTVKDFLFDEDQWVVRYLEADLGFIFPGRKILIPRIFLNEPDWSKHHFPVSLFKNDLDRCPSLDDKLPVSKKYEETLHGYYKIGTYWSMTTLPMYAAPIVVERLGDKGLSSEKESEKEANTRLRSFKEIRGYDIQAEDDTIGKIDDIIIDDQNWHFVYAVVDTSSWLPFSKKVLVGTPWMKEVSYLDRKIKIDLPVESIKSAPEFHPSEPVNAEYEKRLYDYYGRPVLPV